MVSNLNPIGANEEFLTAYIGLKSPPISVRQMLGQKVATSSSRGCLPIDTLTMHGWISSAWITLFFKPINGILQSQSLNRATRLTCMTAKYVASSWCPERIEADECQYLSLLLQTMEKRGASCSTGTTRSRRLISLMIDGNASLILANWQKNCELLLS